MLAARSAAEVGAREQNRRATVARLVQHKTGVWLPALKISPVVEQELAVALPRQQLEKLLGDDLIGVNVDAIERRYEPGVFRKWSHFEIPAAAIEKQPPLLAPNQSAIGRSK